MSVVVVQHTEAPEVEKLKGGILDVATVRNGVSGWKIPTLESYACAELEVIDQDCGPLEQPEDPGDPANEKLTYGLTWPEGIRFSAYGYLNCGIIGSWNISPDLGDRPQKMWALAESKAVEKGFMDLLVPTLDAVNLGTVKPVKIALATLEAYAAEHYLGVPTIHLPPKLFTPLFEDGILRWDGGIVRTGAGSKVSLGRGYGDTVSPTGTAPTAGQSWMYVTGEVLVERVGELSDARVADIRQNQAYALVEQVYAITADCLAAGIPAYNFGATS